jgi:hypothetical protein
MKTAAPIRQIGPKTSSNGQMKMSIIIASATMIGTPTRKRVRVITPSTKAGSTSGGLKVQGNERLTSQREED